MRISSSNPLMVSNVVERIYMNALKEPFFVSVLPPVLVPRYSEYPSHIPHGGMNRMMPSSSSFHHIQEPVMPYNVSYPHGFHDRSSGVSSPGSSYGLPGKQI